MERDWFERAGVFMPWITPNYLLYGRVNRRKLEE